jgi:hypothetical protein
MRGQTESKGTDVLKKIAIVGAVSAAALVTVGGVAFADSANPDCSHDETVKQKTKALIGGNAYGRDINGAIAGSIDHPVACPSAFNNNSFKSHDDSDDSDD